MNSRLDELIEKGKGFSFDNNCQHTSHGIYSKASDDFLAWIAGIEDFLTNNYDEESGPAKLFSTLDRKQLSGNYQSSFEKQLQILRGVLISCKDIPPFKRKKQDDNLILSLLKNPLFWTAIVVLMGGSFALGFQFGNTKFDNNLIELSQTKKDLQDTIASKEKIIQTIRHNSDSALNILGHMPYNEMKLDTLEFRKVQTNIESAGGVLYLNK
jgi:hypothetical protein